MNNVDEVIQVILTALIVASFLLNTSRYLTAIELCKECLFILRDIAAIIDEKFTKSFYKRIYFTLWKACSLISDNTNALKYAEKLLQICYENGKRLEECRLSIKLGETYFNQSKYIEAIQLSEKALQISRNIGDREGEASCNLSLGVMYQSVGEYERAKGHLEKLLSIHREIGDRNGDAALYLNLGIVCLSVGEYEKVREYLEKSLVTYSEIRNRKGEATSRYYLGVVCRTFGDYEKAKEHLEKSLVIFKEIGDRNGEACCHVSLGVVYQSVGEYERAKGHLEKSLSIHKEIGDRNGEAASYLNLGTLCLSVGEYEKAREHLEKSLVIYSEIRNRKGEATSRYYLGPVCRAFGDYEKAKKHLEESLVIFKEIGDRNGEASSYVSLGTVYQAAGKYEKARELLEKSLAVQKEIGNRKGEAASYLSLGSVCGPIGDYEKAREHLESALVIQNEIGDKEGEAIGYINFGTVYASVGEYEKALDYCQKSLAISKKIGNKLILAVCYYKLGANFFFLGKYSKANEYNQKALAMFKDIGDREVIAKTYLIQGAVECTVGNSVKARGYFEKAIAISNEIGNGDVKAAGCSGLGVLLIYQAEYERGEEYIKRALALSEAVGDFEKQFHSLIIIAHVRMKEGNIWEAISYFLSAIAKSEEMRTSLRDNDQFKISFTDHNIRSYRDLSALLCATGNPTEALYVSELSNARALADLMSAQYSVENRIAANPLTWAGIEGIVDKECNSNCLYVSYHFESIYLWILREGRVTHFQKMKGNDLIAHEGLSQQVEEFFDFRRFGVLPEEICEDRSLHGFQPESRTYGEDSHQGWRIGVESKTSQGPIMNLPLCYKLIIAPVVDFLEGPEIIIVPDRALYQIPFAALTDKSGKFLSETFRIRLVPSLKTLKLINESPADYHSQTGALIVGNPDVGEVDFKGKLTNISRLQCAENEAKMIAEKLGVEPLLGQQATKEAVLQAMKSVALIHIAAHGDAERGEIALTPSFRIPNGIPQEGLYLLTMSDISKVQLRAKLVVLSCCHSARGQTKAEGAVGIARAFLGSGARSVLVALWALDDKATEQLMSHFYEHLLAGESACESLHEAMKWMRNEGYDVNQWAPFILIGDDVTIDFRKKGEVLLKEGDFLYGKGLLVFI